MAVDLRETRLENKQVRDKKDNKGVTDYFRENLVQVNDAKDLPPVREALAMALNHQQLLVLQSFFNTAAEYMWLSALNHCDTLLVEYDARARVQDVDPGRTNHGTSPLRPRAAYGHGPEVPERLSIALRYGSLRRGCTFPGRRGNPLSTRRRNLTSNLFCGPREVAQDAVDCRDLLWR